MNTRRALAFIFCTVALDCLAVGIMIPVLPVIILTFMDGNTASAATVFGVAGCRCVDGCTHCCSWSRYVPTR